MKNSNPIKSRFKRNESFDYDEVPKHFVSITEKSIHDVKNYCAKIIGNKFPSMEPAALRAMLETIDGEFGPAYAMLEGDYNTRRGNLDQAYQEGLADIQQDLLELDQEIDDHNALYEEYADIVEKITGRRPSATLAYSKEKLETLEERYRRIA